MQPTYPIRLSGIANGSEPKSLRKICNLLPKLLGDPAKKQYPALFPRIALLRISCELPRNLSLMIRCIYCLFFKKKEDLQKRCGWRLLFLSFFCPISHRHVFLFLHSSHAREQNPKFSSLHESILFRLSIHDTSYLRQSTTIPSSSLV